MKKTITISLAITILLIAIALLSLTKCVTVTDHPATHLGFSVNTENYEEKAPTVTQERYVPGFVCVLTGIELLLLWAVKKRFARWIGLLLNITVTMGPWFSFMLRFYVFKSLNASVELGYKAYAPRLPLFLIFVLGAAAAALYVLLLRACKKPAPEIKGDPS